MEDAVPEKRESRRPHRGSGFLNFEDRTKGMAARCSAQVPNRGWRRTYTPVRYRRFAAFLAAGFFAAGFFAFAFAFTFVAALAMGLSLSLKKFVESFREHPDSEQFRAVC